MAQDIPLPSLDFGEWRVAFPPRGHHAFLPSRSLVGTLSDDPPANESGLWLARAESGASLVIPAQLRVLRSGLPIVGLATLHHGERLDFAGHAVWFKEVRRAQVEPGGALVNVNCPQCHSPLEEGVKVICCPLCSSPYHDDCWNYIADKRCYSRSCHFSPALLD